MSTPFSENIVCPKCGAPQPDTMWLSAATAGTPTDVVRCQCRHCRHWWDTKPINPDTP